jgi:hypothetical protein
VPANRSRTLRWRTCLDQICQRSGAIEIAIARSGGTGDDRHLVWRVRLLEVGDDAILVEQPAALGQAMPIATGAEIVGIISVGQNRWMFASRNLGTEQVKPAGGRTITCLRLAVPEEVERCQRRSHYRVRTAALNLPDVDVWPLLDPRSVTVAERASELGVGGDGATGNASEDLLPEVGPRFPAVLLNLGGGGVGLGLRPEDCQALLRHKHFWIRISLPEGAPICASAKVAHTHLEAAQSVYVGMAFDFSFNPSHQAFVVEQICKYLNSQQDYSQRKIA